MKKKITCFLVIMLMISSAITTVLFSNEMKVEASGGDEENVDGEYPLDFVWSLCENFSNVIRNVDWFENGGNGIPRGRAWATAGENYTRDKIIWPNMGRPDNPCGLTGYTNLTIGPLQSNLTRKYSNAIVIKDYNLTIHNISQDHYIPYSEMFPIGVGNNWLGNDLNSSYGFQEATIIEKDLFLDSLSCSPYFVDHVNVSVQLLNTATCVYGIAVFLDNNDTLPENQDDLVFIMNETEDCQEKIENITSAVGCILLNNPSFGYSYNQAGEKYFPILRVDESNQNITEALAEMKNGSLFFVDNFNNTNNVVFTNLSNDSCVPNEIWVFVIKRTAPSHSQSWSSNGLIYDFSRLMAVNIRWYIYNFSHPDKGCKGLILSDETDTHFMTHTTRDWTWFMKEYLFPFSNRWWIPMFSVNDSIGKWLIKYNETMTVTGFIDQEYRQQTPNHPGVISHNVVAYRNITHSPDDAIVILSNRMDGWWGETPGDSGVGGAILLGIAKYFNDNHITPKYNLTFLFTTGEEVGMRGAQHFIDSHPKGTGEGQYNFIQFIGFDQLCFNNTLSNNRLNLSISVQDDNTTMIIQAINNDTQYDGRTGYGLDVEIPTSYGSEDYVWKNHGVNTICFVKDNSSIWDGYHHAGNNFSDGDSLKYIDRNDVNVTFELAWNITKYFTVNPHCWFSNITFTAFDSPNDGDTLNDSIQADFTIHSVLPSDRVRVTLDYQYNISGAGGFCEDVTYVDYTLTSRCQNESFIFTMPEYDAAGNYSLTLRLYNSTGRINKIIYDSSEYNDTSDASGWFHLYHPLGYTNVGESYKCVDDNISGCVFTAHEDARADNITAYINMNYMSPGPYTCLLYRANDSMLVGTTTDEYTALFQGNPEPSVGWAVFNFTGTKPLLKKGTQYVITCWGDSAFSWLYYDTSSVSTTGKYDIHTYGTPPNPACFTNEPRFYSLYCSYTPDVTPPYVINITASPHTVGFGYNVTITANVTDPGSGVHQVNVRIGEPGMKIGNFTMTHVTGDMYQYVYTKTWCVGEYNYTIWAQDNYNNSNTSDVYQFTVSANATISVATLADKYDDDEYINLTDPPAPDDNLTLVASGLTWNKYYNASSGCNILEVSTGPVNYQATNGTWIPINETFIQLPSNNPAYTYGYRIGNNRGAYGAYFKPNTQNTWPVAFTYNRADDTTTDVIRSKLVGVGYIDPQNNWTYHYLQSIQSSQALTYENSITYPNVFTGTDVTWTYTNTELKEEIILHNTTKTLLQNHPPSHYGLNDASSYLMFITKLDYHNLNLYSDSGLLDGNITITDIGVDFKDALGQFKCAMPLGDAYELNNNMVRQRLTYRIIHLNGEAYLLSGLKLTDLQNMSFPVVIDPTLTLYSATSDGYLYKSSTSYTTAHDASSGTVSSSATSLSIGQRLDSGSFPSVYYVYRGFVFFNTSTIPTNAYLDTVVLSLYKKDDYSTTDFLITVQNGQPTYPHNPLQSADYNKNYYSEDGGNKKYQQLQQWIQQHHPQQYWDELDKQDRLDEIVLAKQQRHQQQHTNGQRIRRRVCQRTRLGVSTQTCHHLPKPIQDTKHWCHRHSRIPHHPSPVQQLRHMGP